MHTKLALLLSLGMGAACASPHTVVVPVEPAAKVDGEGTPFAQEFDLPSTLADPATLGPPVSLTMQFSSNAWRTLT